nr:hypothetical protein [uncultured Flavobacterium sp.]
MTNNLTDTEWIRIKKQFGTGLFISVLITFAFLIWPGYKTKIKESEFIREDKILDHYFFKVDRHGKNTSYLVEVTFLNDNNKYEIDGVDYNYLKKRDFDSEIASKDTISISRFENSIHSFSKNGKDYLDYNKAETNRKNTILSLGLLFVPQILISVFALTRKTYPTYTYNNKNYKLKMHIVVISTLVITYIILKIIFKFEVIFNGEFIDY